MTASCVLHQTPVFTGERHNTALGIILSWVFAQENSKAIHNVIQFCLELLQNTKKCIHSNVFNNMCQNEVEAFVLCSNCFCGLIKMVKRKEHHFEDSPLYNTAPHHTPGHSALQQCPYTTLDRNQDYHLKTNCLELRTAFPHNFPYSSSNTINIPPFKS